MSAKNVETCPYCKRSMMVHQHKFNESLARIVLDIANHFGPGQPFHLQKDFPNWTHNQYNNFQKLQYFLLAEKHRDFVGKRAGGYWHLTEQALWLLNCQRAFLVTFSITRIKDALPVNNNTSI